MTQIAEGQSAPEFSLPVDGGGEVTLAGLKGRTVVLYFYPKADTPGCTNEAKDLRPWPRTSRQQARRSSACPRTR